MNDSSAMSALSKGHVGMLLAHRAMALDLERIATRANAVANGADCAVAPFAEYARRIAGIIEHHHEGEDAFLWPSLRERGADLDSLELMDEEHRQLAGPLHTLIERVGELAGGERSAAGDVADYATNVREILVHHCADEEQDLSGRLAPSLDDALWKAFEKHMVKTAAPWTLWFMPPWLESVALSHERAAIPGRPVAFVMKGRLRRMQVAAFGPDLSASRGA